MRPGRLPVTSPTFNRAPTAGCVTDTKSKAVDVTQEKESAAAKEPAQEDRCQGFGARLWPQPVSCGGNW